MEPQESLLSEELRAELGDDSIIVTKKTKKEAEATVSKESLEVASKLSKAAKKRKLQIESRKLKESQRQTYFDVIKQHEISDAHRDLMKSSREVGQSMTYGQTVKHIFKKHRLGMALSEGEMNLLFPTQQNEDTDVLPDSDVVVQQLDGPSGSEKSDMFIGNESARLGSESEEVVSGDGPLIDVAALLRPDTDSDTGHSSTVNASKKAKKKGIVSDKTTSTVSETSSVGAKLLAKFNKLKEKLSDAAQSVAVTATSSVPVKTSPGTENETIKIAQSYLDEESHSNTSVYVPSSIDLDAVISSEGRVREEPVPAGLTAKRVVDSKKTKCADSLRLTRKPVPVRRHPNVQASRLELPICRMEQEIVEAVNDNDVIILCGETGSGKSTQIPQFLFESGYAEFGRIAVTQPRRVAATSTADRVRFELCGVDSRQSHVTKGNRREAQTNTNDVAPQSKLLPDLTPMSEVRNTSFGRLKRLTVPPANRCGRFRLKVVHALEKRARLLLSGEQGLDESHLDDAEVYQTKSNHSAESGAVKRGASALSGDLVGHQIRFDSSTVTDNTRIVFMTDGILLREIASDLLLRKYSVIVVDEAHERGVNTDILLGMLSRAVLVRKQQAEAELQMWTQLPDAEKIKFEKPIQPLKLIIMSATLKISDFQNPRLFPEKLPPVLNVEARQYPVTVHFAKQTNVANYLGETFKKVVQIHRRLPAGGILVFLTGKREILYMCRKLRSKLLKGWRRALPTPLTGDNAVDYEIDATNDIDPYSSDTDEIEGLDASDAFGDSEEESDVDDDGDLDDDDDGDDEWDPADGLADTGAERSHSVNASGHSKNSDSQDDTNDVRNKMLQSLFGPSTSEAGQGTEKSLNPTADENMAPGADQADEPVRLKPVVLPLYAMLSPKQQNKIFQELPANCRLIVVATNVAETSITIPGIRYVVDCGRQKEQVRLMPSGVSKFEIKWISQMSAEQRKGRAGRVGPGHVYRLYSSAFFDQHLPRFQAPSILTTPLEDLLLQMKAMGIDDIDSFPFPTPPAFVAVKKAQDLLLQLGALTMRDKNKDLSSLDIIDFIKRGRAAEGVTGSVAVSQEEIDRFLFSHQAKSQITELGKLMAQFPLSPRFSKMLIVAYKTAGGLLNGLNSVHIQSALSSRLVQFALSIVATLSEKSPFLHNSEKVSANDEESSDGESDDGDSVDDETSGAELARHPHGDILARLRAFSAYAYTCFNDSERQSSSKSNSSTEKLSAGEDFCRRLNLHSSTLQRCLDLRQQISRVLTKSSVTGEDSELAINSWWSLSPITDEEDVALRQIMLSGYPDSIAKKAPFDLIKSGSRRKRLTAYISCDASINEPLYIHPSSSMYRKDPSAPLPEYVLYDSLMKNKRGDMTYMSGVTVVQKQWIAAVGASSPLLKWSPPLASPPPFYDSEADAIICYSRPRYGPHGWELPAVRRHMIDCLASDAEQDRAEASTAAGFRKPDECHRWFARFLLEGCIFKDISDLSKLLTSENMLDAPSVITQMKPLPKVVNLLRALVAKSIASKRRLLEVLQSESTFLAPEIEDFLKPGFRAKFRTAWCLLV